MVTVWGVVKLPPPGEIAGSWTELEEMMVMLAEAVPLQPNRVS